MGGRARGIQVAAVALVALTGCSSGGAKSSLTTASTTPNSTSTSSTTAPATTTVAPTTTTAHPTTTTSAPKPTTTASPTTTVAPKQYSEDDTNSGGTVTMHVGDTDVITLQANATTGYAWTVTKAPTASVVAVTANTYVPDPCPTMTAGCGGHQVLHLKAVGKGSTGITLGYARYQQPPAKTYTLTFAVS